LEDRRFHDLLRRLKDAESHLCVFHQSSSLQRGDNKLCSVGFFNNQTDISIIKEKELPLAHSMLHMFYGGNGGRNLSTKTIEKLHSDVVGRLKSHKKFDSLDNK